MSTSNRRALTACTFSVRGKVCVPAWTMTRLSSLKSCRAMCMDLVTSGAEVRLSRIVYDKYGGRVRASVADARGDIGQAMLAAGLARAYHGEKRLAWCDAG